MSKDKISDYSETPGNNTDIGGINIAEGMLPSDVNNAIREQMAQLKKFQSGTSSESVTFVTANVTTANAGQVNVDNLRLDGNVLSSTNTNGNIELTPNGNGRVTTSALSATSPRVITSINDTNGNELFGVTATGSAVNEFTVANAATGNAPTLSATGGDTNIGIRLQPKGTGGVVFNAGAVGTPAITTTGDLNTGIYFPAADTIGFVEGGAEAMRIDSSGNVGIGTTSPRSTGVLGTAQLSLEKASFAVMQLFGNGNTAGNSGYIGLWKARGGVVGGTTNVQNNDVFGGTYFGGWADGDFRTGAFIQAEVDGSTISSTSMPGRITFATTASGSVATTERMRIDSSGNVGIGISPSVRFQVAGASNSNYMRLSGDDVSGARALDFTSSAIGGVNGALHTINAKSVEGTIAFATANTERARITSGGYFKASNNGTYNNATGSFHEWKSDFQDWTGVVQNTNATSPNGILVIYTGATPNNTSNFFLRGDDSTATRVEIRSNGGLANYSANNVNLASDERLKKDISAIDSTWDKVKQIEVVNFRYKDCNEGDPALYGVIAQQVQPIVPELVVVTQEAREAVEAKEAVLDDDGNVIESAIEAKEATPEYFGIREQPMYWLAVKALQEAMERIETLEAKVAALEND